MVKRTKGGVPAEARVVREDEGCLGYTVCQRLEIALGKLAGLSGCLYSLCVLYLFGVYVHYIVCLLSLRRTLKCMNPLKRNSSE